MQKVKEKLKILHPCCVREKGFIPSIEAFPNRSNFYDLQRII